MALEDVCAKLLSGQSSACVNLIKRYYQQIVIIPKTDFLEGEVLKTDYAVESPICKYGVEFTLKTGKKGYRFSGPANGNSFFLTVDKTTTDNGHVQYAHTVNMLFAGLSESDKCILEALDKGTYVVALQQMGSDLIEIAGYQFGLSTGDYTLDPVSGGGAVQITLTSNENSLENYLPLIYKSAVDGGEVADFDSDFANPTV